MLTAELLTVNSGGLEKVHELFAPYEEYVDAVNATDNTAAHAHASPLAVAIALQQFGMEPVMQLVCRDRNRLALEAEIAGAALHGIENICCLTGDDVTAGDEPEARRVFDLDSIQLLATAHSMRNGTYLSGRKIDPAPRLFLGAVENPQAPPQGYRVEYGGQFESEAAASKQLGLLSLLVVIGIFLILMTAFGSIRDALIVMLNLPLALVGGVIGVFIAGGVLSVASIIGFISS